MRGNTISKRGKRWAFTVDLPRGEDDKRRQKMYSLPTKKAAERKLTEVLSQLDNSTFVEPTKISTAQFLNDWVAALPLTDIKPSTRASYEMNMRRHIIPAVGSVPLQQLTTARVNKLYTDMLAGGLSQQSVRYAAMILRRALAKAIATGQLTRNPADAAERPKRVKSTMHTWRADELRGFLERISGEPMYPAILLSATTGARRGEVLGVRWRDLDLDARRMSIAQTLIAIGYHTEFSTPKTTGSKRLIDLDDVTVAALRRHRTQQLEARLAMGAGYTDLDLVFARPDGSPVHPERLTRTFGRLAKAAAMPVIRLHDLRHTWATLALQNGVHAKVVQERLGHSQISTTLDTYSHTVPAMQADAADTVARAIFGKAL